MTSTTATVVAEVISQCFVLFKATFQALLDKNPIFKNRLRKLSFDRALETRKI
ncbi:MAG: hypothetical protein VX667_02795 [Nitrospinota bacterium]|nr:hypothetical protein [Nitrospinota bacterium]